MALTDPHRHTEETLIREGDPPMAQTPTKTPLQYAPERPRADWVKYALFGAALVLLVVGVLLLRPNNTPVPAPAPPAAAATVPAAQQQAAADTEKVLRAWISNYTAASTTFDATLLNPSLATADVLATAKADFDNLKPVSSMGTAGKYTVEIRDVVAGPYTSDKMTLTVCALRDFRFLNNGKDVTLTRDRQPSPLATQALWQTTEFTRVSGAWKVSDFTLDTEAGPPC